MNNQSKLEYLEFEEDVQHYMSDAMDLYDLKISKDFITQNYMLKITRIHIPNRFCFLENKNVLIGLNILDAFPHVEVWYRFYLKGKANEYKEIKSIWKLDSFLGLKRQESNYYYQQFEENERKKFRINNDIDDNRIGYQESLCWNNIAFTKLYYPILDGTYTLKEYSKWNNYVNSNYDTEGYKKGIKLPSFEECKERNLF